MKSLLAVVFCLLLSFSVCHAQTEGPVVISYDVENFWEAYDAITATRDSARQYELLSTLFIEPGSPGLHALMQRRGYTAASYIEAINAYPAFWKSVRDNTFQTEVYAREIEDGIRQLRLIYPDARPAHIYFTVGALMTGGTTLDSLVLIGTEIAMADSTVVTRELPARLGESLRAHFDTNPVESVTLLNVHEYVHTQQGAFGSTLLAVSLQEGVAEFVSVLATGRPSSTPALAFGEVHAQEVRARFATEMFSPNWNDWLYNNFDNDFGVRDLGYYVGYAIAKRYYDRADDKKRAVQRLIELDYQDQNEVEAIVQESGYFSRPLDALKAAYTRNVPTVIGISQFDNGDRNVDPAISLMRVTFSVPMSRRFWGFDYGPLGEENVLRIRRLVGFSKDGRTANVEVELRPSHRQQLVLSQQFRSREGAALHPYLIDLTTGPSRARRE